MSISMAPSAVIFINTDLVPQVQGVFVSQLFINQLMTGAEFDANVAANSSYVQNIHASGQRILVMRDLSDMTNRNLADIVLFAKAGLVTVESNKVGPPGITLPIARVYLTALINLNMPRRSFHHDDDDDDDDKFRKFPFGTDHEPEPEDVEDDEEDNEDRPVLDNDLVNPHEGLDITEDEWIDEGEDI